MGMSDKLQVSRQTRMIHEHDVYHGQSAIVWGTTLNRSFGEEEDLTRGRMSMHRVCVCVCIMLDKTTSDEQHHPVERVLRLCVGSASSIGVMF